MGHYRVGLNVDIPDRWNALNDIILRPSDREPGFYEDPEGIVPVVRHEDGKPYTMLFFDLGEGHKHLQEGDVLFIGAYPMSQTITYPEGGPLIAETTGIVIGDPLMVKIDPS